MTHEYIPMDKCIKGHIYKIDSRNLDVGVYTADEGGFIGLRYKFGNLYLFTENHHDTGAPFGTVKPIKDIGVLPEGIELRESGDTYDPTNGRLLAFDKPTSQGGKGWYYKDTGEPKQNKALFDFLEEIERTLPTEETT